MATTWDRSAGGLRLIRPRWSLSQVPCASYIAQTQTHVGTYPNGEGQPLAANEGLPGRCSDGAKVAVLPNTRAEEGVNQFACFAHAFISTPQDLQTCSNMPVAKNVAAADWQSGQVIFCLFWTM